MMASPLAALPPFDPTAMRQAIAGSAGLLAGQDKSDFPVPPSAFAEAPGVAKSRIIQDWHKAGDFAAMAIGALLQPMFDTVHLAQSRFGGGAGEAAWKPILVQAIGQGIASKGGLGITETVFRELIREQQAAAVPAAAPAAGPPPSPSTQSAATN